MLQPRDSLLSGYFPYVTVTPGDYAVAPLASVWTTLQQWFNDNKPESLLWQVCLLLML